MADISSQYKDLGSLRVSDRAIIYSLALYKNAKDICLNDFFETVKTLKKLISEN